MKQEVLEEIRLLLSDVRSILRTEVEKQASLTVSVTDDQLHDMVADEIKHRKLRLNFLPSELFGEGGWNILLDLLLHEFEGKKVSISSASIASGLAPTTALRVMDMLISLKLIERGKADHDGRVAFLNLTQVAREQLRAYFISMQTPNSDGIRLIGGVDA